MSDDLRKQLNNLPEMGEVQLDVQTERALEAHIESVQKLKKDGQPKPAEVSWGDFMGPKKMSPAHFVVAQMMAMGAKNGEISKATGRTLANVSNLMSNSLVRAYSDKIRSYITSDAKAHFEQLIPRSVQVFDEVLNDPNETQKLRVDVASRILDRSWGKPATHEESAGNTALEILRSVKDLVTEVRADSGSLGHPTETEVNAAPTTVVSEESTSERVNEAEKTTETDEDPLYSLLNSWEVENNEGSHGKKEEN